MCLCEECLFQFGTLSFCFDFKFLILIAAKLLNLSNHETFHKLKWCYSVQISEKFNNSCSFVIALSDNVSKKLSKISGTHLLNNHQVKYS